MPRERRTPPSTTALDDAVLDVFFKHDHGNIYLLVAELSMIWCDVTYTAIEESLRRLVANGAIVPLEH
jgi:hypothetical protein